MATFSDSAYNYAAVLAWAAHVDHLKSSFDSVAEDASSSMEKTCWAEELSIGLRVIRNYALRTLADHYYGEDSELSAANGLFSILGDAEPSPMMSASSVEDLLDKLDLSVEATNALVQDPVVVERLYVTLKSAISKHVKDTETFSDARAVLSRLLVEYLSSQQHLLTSVNAFEGLASETTAYLKGDLPAPCGWSDVFETFKQLLAYHIEMVSAPSSSKDTTLLKVSRLRETGNNLSANTCYPQAIMVYTDAIHTCDHTTRTHLPQLFTNRAIAYIGLNCFPEAVSDLEAALQHDRTFVPAWTQMGYCQLYLGSTMLSLKCYLAALRSISGEIYPYKFPTTESLRHEYTEARASTVMPQFVQKLVSAIILAVRRAEQQKEPGSAIQEIATRVRAILARLRSHVTAEDLHYLEYSPDPDIESLRSMAIRADTVRPSILTPDVAQDIMASANVEASAVTLSGPPTVTDLPIPIVPLSNGTQTVPESGAETRTQPNTSNSGGAPGIRGFLNTLGDVVGDVIQASTTPGTDGNNQSNAPESANRTSNTTEGENRAAAPGAEPLHNHITRALASVRRAISSAQQNPDAQGGISEALQQHQAAMQRLFSPNGAFGPNTVTTQGGTARAGERPGSGTPAVRIVHPRGNPENAPTRPALATASAAQQVPHARRPSPSAEDTEMPDAPDLD